MKENKNRKFYVSTEVVISILVLLATLGGFIFGIIYSIPNPFWEKIIIIFGSCLFGFGAVFCVYGFGFSIYVCIRTVIDWMKNCFGSGG